jgi:hypothetical protein
VLGEKSKGRLHYVTCVLVEYDVWLLVLCEGAKFHCVAFQGPTEVSDWISESPGVVKILEFRLSQPPELNRFPQKDGDIRFL